MTLETRRRPGRRSEEEARRTRTRILDCAERLFARQGYEGLSTREVAREAGVHNQTVHHHFGTKAGLFASVVKRWDEDLMTKLGGALSDTDGDFETLVDTALDVLLDYFVEKRDWLAITARLGIGEDAPTETGLSEEGWQGFMQRGLSGLNLDVSEHDQALLLFTIEGALHYHLLSGDRYQRLLGRGIDDPEQLAATKAHLKRSILALVAAHAAPDA